jgi:Peptidase A4 family
VLLVRGRRRLVLWALPAVAALVGAAVATPAQTTIAQLHVSTNWSGYAVTAPAGKTLHFGQVSGTWRIPRVHCSAGRGSSLAVWVGIGGFKVHSPSLQQLGISADCSPAGRVSYEAWTEIVPAPAHFLRFKVAAGDTMRAAVLQKGRRVTLQLFDLTRKTRYSSTVTSKAAVDTSSAEWIVEAPSLCRSANTCTVVPLTRFGTVAFNSAQATAGGRTSPILSSGWQTVPLALASTNGADDLYSADSNPSGAVPSTLLSGGTSFSVTYRAQLLPPQNFEFGLPRAGAPLPPWIR